jgi:hypothetical protein
MRQTSIVRRSFLYLSMIFLVGLTGVVSAHHATSSFDKEQLVSVSGTVLRWQFINPHSGLWLEVAGDDEEITEWTGEFQGTLDLYRHFSFNKNTFAPGDPVTLTGYPDRKGEPTMSVRFVVFSDGREVDVRSAPD